MSSESTLEIAISRRAGYSDAGDHIAEKAKDAFETLGALLSDAIGPFRESLAKAGASADEVELKLDLALKGSGKWVVVSVEGGATVSVKLVWKK